ncbi:MAG: hypothetical protein QOC60_1164 [Frankiaceae bacterium]|nr:hypothetical protein [Frankiaceae bacterium]
MSALKIAEGLHMTMTQRPTTAPVIALPAPARLPLLTVRVHERALLRATAIAATVSRHRLSTFVWAARRGGALAARSSAPAAVATVLHSYRTVPAYRDFLDGFGGLPPRPRGMSPEAWLELLPTTSKHSYIDRYPVAQRCRGGILPTRGVEIDESAGSSGTPYQWARSGAELSHVHTTLALLSRYLLGSDKDIVTLNAFSMGAWSTGVNVSHAMKRIGAVKSCGPDADKCLDVLRLYGTDVRYAVCGYPPFLQQLVRRAADRGLDLTAYDLVGFVGGEGMGEGLRREVEQTFARVWSAYGASDLDIGVAAETPVSVWLRQAADADPSLARALFGRVDRLPMVFQYDPSTYHITTIEAEHGTELVATVLRETLTPKLRYRVGDAGGTLTLAHALTLAKAHGHVPDVDRARWGADFALPLLFIHGRADSTVSFMGANLYPEDIAAGVEDAGAGLAPLLPGASAARLGGFSLELRGDLEPRPVIHIELEGCTGLEVERSVALTSYLVTTLRDRLARNSDDYRVALGEDPRAAELFVELHEPGTGVFAVNAGRIKRRYLVA